MGRQNHGEHPGRWGVWVREGRGNPTGQTPSLESVESEKTPAAGETDSKRTKVKCQLCLVTPSPPLFKATLCSHRAFAVLAHTPGFTESFQQPKTEMSAPLRMEVWNLRGGGPCRASQLETGAERQLPVRPTLINHVPPPPTSATTSRQTQKPAEPPGPPDLPGGRHYLGAAWRPVPGTGLASHGSQRLRGAAGRETQCRRWAHQ